MLVSSPRLRALEVLADFDEIDDPAVLMAKASELLRRHGYSAFVLSRLPRRPVNQAPEILLNGWPEGWSDRYEQASHYTRDPVAAYCAETVRPFSWAEIPRKYMQGELGHRVVNEASEFGLVQGLCIPIHTVVGAGGMSLAGEAFQEEPGVRTMASILSFKICTVLEKVGPMNSGGAYLSSRERDVLSWIAMGKTTEDVGSILSISAHTVGEHLKKIRSKLQASNNVHAVVRALQSGQLRL